MLSFAAVSVRLLVLVRSYLAVDWMALEGHAGLVAPATPVASSRVSSDRSRHDAGHFQAVLSMSTCIRAHPITRWSAFPQGFASAIFSNTAANRNILSCWHICLSLLRYAFTLTTVNFASAQTHHWARCSAALLFCAGSAYRNA